jgi:hypothetical protein
MDIARAVYLQRKILPGITQFEQMMEAYPDIRYGREVIFWKANVLYGLEKYYL